MKRGRGPDGNDVATGDVGTLWIKGESAAQGYWPTSEKSRNICRRLVLYQRQFRRDETDISIIAVERMTCSRSAVFLFSIEVENCLLAHDAVEECCVGYGGA